MLNFRSHKLFIKKTPSRLVVVLFLFLFIASCINDNLDECVQNITFHFEYTLNSSNEDLFNDKINHLDLLMYDRNGYKIQTHHLLQENLDEGAFYSLTDLPNGRYTIVVWANTTKNNYIKDYTLKIEDMRLMLKTLSSNIANPTHDSFFHGMTTILVNNSMTQPIPVSLTKNTNIVHVLIEETGFDTPLQITDYIVEITGSNGTYNFENNTVNSDLLHYTAKYTYPSQHSLQVNFTLLRLLIGDDLRVRIKTPDSKIIYDELLVDKIMENPSFQTNEDLDRCDEYTLKFNIKKDDGAQDFEIELVAINDWTLVEQNGGI